MSWTPKSSIVVPIDFSELSGQALETARELTDDVTKIHVVHVLHGMSMGEPGVYWEAFDKQVRADGVVQAFRMRYGSSPLEKSDFQVRLGDPGHEIAEFAQQVNADLIVMPSHGRGGVSRLLLGSVAERVRDSRIAQC